MTPLHVPSLNPCVVQFPPSNLSFPRPFNLYQTDKGNPSHSTARPSASAPNKGNGEQRGQREVSKTGSRVSSLEDGEDAPPWGDGGGGRDVDRGGREARGGCPALLPVLASSGPDGRRTALHRAVAPQLPVPASQSHALPPSFILSFPDRCCPLAASQPLPLSLRSSLPRLRSSSAPSPPPLLLLRSPPPLLRSFLPPLSSSAPSPLLSSSAPPPLLPGSPRPPSPDPRLASFLGSNLFVPSRLLPVAASQPCPPSSQPLQCFLPHAYIPPLPAACPPSPLPTPPSIVSLFVPASMPRPPPQIPLVTQLGPCKGSPHAPAAARAGIPRPDGDGGRGGRGAGRGPRGGVRRGAYPMAIEGRGRGEIGRAHV